MGGFSTAYTPSWLLFQLSNSPWHLITLISFGSSLLAGWFIILLSEEFRLQPIAGLIAGISYATAPVVFYWLTFPMVSATYCWAAGAMLGIVRLSNDKGIWAWAILAFSVYSLIYLARKQAVVSHIYILLGYWTYLTFCIGRRRPQYVMRFIIQSLSAATVGIFLCLPMLVDLFYIGSDSLRASPDVSFFTDILPKLNDLNGITRFFVLTTFPEIFGNPISPAYPFSYNGLSLTIPLMFFAFIGATASLKNIWGWFIPVVAFVLMTFVHPIYEFSIKYLGFGLSRSLPLGNIMLPLVIITMFGVDSLSRRAVGAKSAWTVRLSFFLYC